MRAVALLALALGASARVERAHTRVTPVEKVVELMNGMLAKGKDEKHAEEVQFAEYKQWCDDTSVEKTRAIAEANEEIEKLSADIEKYTADAELLAKEITEHDEDIAAWTGDLKAAATVRQWEKASYDTTHKDYSESISALERAIEVLKEQAHDRPQAAASLLQLQAVKTSSLRTVDQDAQRSIDAFLALQQSTSYSTAATAMAAPEADGYEFQSHGVIEMLHKLLDKFEAELTALENEERSNQQAYEMLKQDLEAEIATAKDARSTKLEVKAKKLEAKADAEGDRDDTTRTRNADQKYLDDVTATCAQKASDFEARQKLRAEEIVAIEKAIEIISDDTVSGAAEKHLPGLIQAASSFAQLRATSGAEEALAERATRARLTTYLQRQAQRSNSRVLSLLALRAAADPFEKVKKMISELSAKLLEEANEEAGHKEWCDSELSTNEQTRKEKTTGVEMLHANIDTIEATIANLGEDIVKLNQAIATLDTAMAEATSYRQKEKAKNEETVKDSVDAQNAVAQALTVLKEFYEAAGQATALLQQQDRQAQPEIFDSPYTGMQSENGGVVGMLEVIQSDFARLEAETSAAEDTAQKEYDSFMADSTKDKEAKRADIEHKTAKKQDEEQALFVNKEDLEGTQDELDAALTYFDKLKPSCVEIGVSYDDRVARRKEEIESLQEALSILNGEAVA
jgi:hypothetical protein